MFHQFPNPNAIATHYCKKCKEEIRYVRDSPISDYYIVWLPKRCYFNNYFEESEECENMRKLNDFYSDYEHGLACQVED
jgi:hypothetical protein